MSITRRDFIRTGGALIVSYSAVSWIEPIASAQGPFDTHRSHVDPAKLDSWIAVATDGSVTAYTGKCDFGQGMFTVQTQLVAEELCVPMGRVNLIQCDTDVCPDQGTTSGSQSTPTNFNERNLAQAAATAREALIGMAATQLGEPPATLIVADGVISGQSGKRISYAELIGSKRFNLVLNPNAKRKTPAQWTVLGKPVRALEVPALMTGQFEFVHNVRVPGMLHGRVVRPPEVGATVESIDEDSVRSIRGLVKVVRRKDFIGVVAEKQWQAIEAARQLKVTWKPGPGLAPQTSYPESMKKQPSRDTLVVDSKDVEQKFAATTNVLKASYYYPHQMHGSIGTSCAVADAKADRATVWSATQSVYPTRNNIATLLGMPPDNVRVIFVRGAGCYGLNGADTVSFDAALLSHAVGRPVRVQLSREDEMAWENFGAAFVIDQRAALDANGNIVAWDCENWETSRGGRPGYDNPGNVITGLLLGYQPETVRPQTAAAPTREVRNRDNAVPSYIAGCVNGKCGGAGTVRSERVLTHEVATPFFTGPLRSPSRIQNTFAHECFMDELCANAKADPIDFRLKHLSDKRVIDVLSAAARAAAWERRRFQILPKGKDGMVSGRGVACVAYEGSNGYAALIAEVSVDVATGVVKPTRFVCAIDAGPISNPDGLRNQTEGGILQGMSRALGEEVIWNDKRITSVDWQSYQSLSMGMQVPEVEVVLVNRAEGPKLGAGETAITIVSAAIGNAIFDAAGIRLREVPFTAERVKAAEAMRVKTE